MCSDRRPRMKISGKTGAGRGTISKERAGQGYSYEGKKCNWERFELGSHVC